MRKVRTLKLKPIAILLCLMLVMSALLFAFPMVMAGHVSNVEDENITTEALDNASEDIETLEEQTDVRDDADATLTLDEENIDALVDEKQNPLDETVVTENNDAEIEKTTELPSAMEEDSIIVKNARELKNALTSNKYYSVIYLGANITMDAESIVVNAAIPDLIIDGTPPGSDVTYTFTETRLTVMAPIDISRINSAVLRNINIVGINSTGTFGVGNRKDIVITFENVSYRGPRAVANKSGTTYFKNTDYTFNSSPAYICNKIIFEGENNVTSTRLDDHVRVMHFMGDAPKLEVKENSSLVIDASSVLFSGDTDAHFDMIIGEGAKVELKTMSSIVRDYSCFDNISIAKNASVIFYEEGESMFPIIALQGDLNAEENSEFIIESKNDTQPGIKFFGDNATMQLNSPKLIDLKTPSTSAIVFERNGTIDVTTKALNLWRNRNAQANNSISDLPDYMWNKLDNSEKLHFTQTYVSGAPQKLVHNLTEEEEELHPLNNETMNLKWVSNLLIGDVDLEVEAITQYPHVVKGTTNGQNAGVHYTNINQEKKVAQVEVVEGQFNLSLGTDKIDGRVAPMVVASRDNLKRYGRNSSSILAFVEVPTLLRLPTMMLSSDNRMQRIEGLALSVLDTRKK